MNPVRNKIPAFPLLWPVRSSKGVKIRSIVLSAFQGRRGKLLIDPLIVEFEKRAVRFAPETPVGRLGIKTIDVISAGRRPQKKVISYSDVCV